MAAVILFLVLCVLHTRDDMHERKCRALTRDSSTQIGFQERNYTNRNEGKDIKKSNVSAYLQARTQLITELQDCGRFTVTARGSFLPNGCTTMSPACYS